MKLRKMFSLLVLLMASTTQAYAYLDSSQEAAKPRMDISSNPSKIYVSAQNVQFANQEMHVYINQNWIKTEALFSDASGLYIVDSKGGWTCGFCGYYNTTSTRYCDNCDKER